MKRADLILVLAAQWALLGGMLLITYFGPTGDAMTALIMGFAAFQAMLTLWFDMRLGEAPPLVRLVAVGAASWLSLLYGLGLADWLSR